MRNFRLDLLDGDLTLEENERYRAKLGQLRQTIMAAEPAVLVDGRFEAMINTPTTIIDIAQELIQAYGLIPQTQR